MKYILKKSEKIILPSAANHPVVEEFLSNYTYGERWELAYHGEDRITIENGAEIERENAEFVLNVTQDGVYISGEDYSATMRGFITFLEKIKYEEKENYFYLETGCTYGKPKMKFRCAHLCLFPQTDLQFFRKCVRSCAIVKYSHLIFEFWGMFSFECLKELSYPFAHSKEVIREIVEEANALGVEIIPMFNHIGHASSCRGANGQHVVLDQNPRYAYLYETYGWVWNFKREDVRELQRKMRDELMEVCGKGNYFHLGCDEVHSFLNDEDNARGMAAYINQVAAELREKGRRAIIWHDMMLSQDYWEEKYFGNSSRSVSDILMNSIDKRILIADWQYKNHDGPWKTSKRFKESGFDVVCCPWDDLQNNREAAQTVEEYELCGAIHTTWDTIISGFRSMIYAGKIFYGADDVDCLEDVIWFYSAEVVRKAMPCHGEYEKSGWSEKMTGMLQYL